MFLDEVGDRRLHACIAEHNHASIRVLLEGGFAIVGTHRPADEPITEILLRLDGP